MKAAVFEGMQDIKVHDDYPDPVAGDGEVIIKVHYCAICGSDITNYKHVIYQVPLVMGHEASGVVHAVGTNTTLNVGDRVIPINVSLDVNSTDGMGIFKDGAFAEFLKIKETCVFPLPDNIPLLSAVLIESFANAFRAIKLSGIGKGERVAIIGAGNIGLSFLNVLSKLTEPEYIMVVEPHEFLRERALKIGASAAFKPVMPKIRKYMKESGDATYIFDCVGNQDTIMMAMDIVKRGGTILLEGFTKGTVTIPMFLINNREIGIKGCLGHDEQDIINAIGFFKKGNVNPDDYITDMISIEKIDDAFKRYLVPGERTFVKTVVRM